MESELVRMCWYYNGTFHNILMPIDDLYTEFPYVCVGCFSEYPE